MFIFLKKINYKLFISYLGVCPFIFSLIDLYIFHIVSLILIRDFIILYTLIIMVFIGAMRWNFEEKSDIFEILAGFYPSMFATLMIILNLLNYSQTKILLLINFFLLIQLFIDFLLRKNYQKFFFSFVRVPITFIVFTNILIIFLYK